MNQVTTRTLRSLSGGRLAALLTIFCALLLTAPAATAQVANSVDNVIVVNEAADENNDDGDCSLREAVLAANQNAAVDACDAGGADGDAIRFDTSSEDFADAAASPVVIALSGGELLITGDLDVQALDALTGLTPLQITVDAQGNSRVFDVDTDGDDGDDEDDGSTRAVSFFGLTLTNGNSQVNSSAPDAGGAVDIKGGEEDVTFTNVVVSNSVAGLNGGGIHAGGGASLTVDGSSTITGNQALGGDMAGRGGGGLWGAGTTVIDGNVTISDNEAINGLGSGGGVLNFGGTMTISGATITGNAAARAGGGVENFGDGGHSITLTDATVTDNDVAANANPGNGGGVHSGGGELVVSGGSFSDNTAVEGGGLWTSGTMTIGDSDDGSVSIAGNSATGTAASNGGGGVYNQGGSVTINEGTTISGNTATEGSGSGGGILNNGGQLSVSGAAITGNASARAGGGIEDAGDDDSSVQLASIILDGNDAGTNPGNGGGLHSGGGSVTMTNGTATNNTAVEGGGLWTSGSLSVSEGTLIEGNDATGGDADQGGGGVYNQGGSVTIADITINENSASGAAGSGGGILNNGGTLAVEGGEITGNTSNRAGGGIEDAGDDDSSVELTDVIIDGNDAGTSPGNGGGLHSGGGTVTMSGGTATNNTAVEGGGLWTSGSLSLMDDVLVEDNDATGDDADQGGGGLYNQGGTIDVADATINENSASGAAGSGGGILNNGGTLTVSGGAITGNTSNRAGGGVEDAGGTVTLTDVTLDGNDAGTSPGNGGGLHSGGGEVTISGGAVQNNVAVEGGGLWTNGTLSATDGTALTGNDASGDDAAQGGGGLYVEVGGAAELTDVTVDGNTASGSSGSGGGVFVGDMGTLTVTGGAITANTSSRAGGGVEVADDPATTDTETSVSFDQASVSGNDAGMSPGNGGGLHLGGAGQVTVDRSTFANNTASEGAGLWASAAGTLDVSLSTVSNNTASGDGGGVYDDGDGATVTLTSSTVARNAAGADGGGLRSSGGTFAFGNTIVGDNTAGGSGADCFGAFTSNDYNLIEDADGCDVSGDTGNNITGQDPMLEDLADNGGPTLTHRPSFPGSPVIDAGNASADTDQRLLDRTVDDPDMDDAADGSDIGSVELQSGELPVELVAFGVTTGDGPARSALLSWQTASETNNAGFAIEQQIDGTFQEIGFVEGAGTTTEAQSYSFRAENLDIGTHAFRLRQVDGDGTATLSEAQRVTLTLAEAFTMDGAYPNPFASTATVKFAVQDAQPVQVELYNVLGQRVRTLFDGAVPANETQRVTLRASGLPSGLYIVRIVGEDFAGSERVTIVK